MMRRMSVGRLVRARKAGAWTLVLIGAPLWCLGTAAWAQSTQKRPDWPTTPVQEPPASQRLWPPPEPDRPQHQPASDAEPAPEPAPAPSAKPETPPEPAPLEPRVDPNQRAEAAAAEPPVAPPTPPPPQWPPGGVFVELRSDDPHARIDQISPDGRSVPACVAPCRRVLWRNITYVVQTDQAPPTSAFLLPDRTDHLTLDVHAGSQLRRNVGMALVAAGGVAALFGLTRANQTGSSSSNNHSSIELLGLGAAGAIAGVVLVRMGNTSVTSSTGATFSERDRRGTKACATPAIALTPQGLVF